MITTRESIESQLTIVFGYSSPDRDIRVGEIIGPGKLTKDKTKTLVLDLINFLGQYNGMLRDYAGAEIFFIEFELYNFDEEDAKYKLYPHSMIFVGSNYKDCESLMLALKPEVRALKIHESRKSLDKISRLFFEVEEFTKRPDLNKIQKEQVLEKFTTHFSLKLQGDLLEGKWNKKLVGLKATNPTEDELFNTYSEIKTKSEIKWGESPPEVWPNKPEFSKISLKFNNNVKNEHIKYSISDQSAYFIVLNTLKLGANLLKIANTGTIDEIQEKICQFFLGEITYRFQSIQELKNIEWVNEEIKKILDKTVDSFNKYFEYASLFKKSGETGDLEGIIEKYNQFISKKSELSGLDSSNFNKLIEFSLRVLLKDSENIRAIETESIINYFNESFKNTLEIFQNSLPTYFFGYRLKILLKKYIKKLRNLMDKEQKPAKVLGNRFIDKLYSYISNSIEQQLITGEKKEKYEDDQAINAFKELVDSHIISFFETLDLNISDLISFAQVMMEKDINKVKTHIEKFNVFPQEIKFLLNFILRYSSINRYIKMSKEEEIGDPVSFGNNFYKFLQKRIGGINLKWGDHCLDWIKQFVKKYFSVTEKKEWEIYEIFNDFTIFLEELESKDQDPNNFKFILDKYIGSVSNEEQQVILYDFFKQYELSLEIREEFPKYIRNLIENELKTLDSESEPLIPQNFINSEESQESLYKFLERSELKYFSKLIARPLSVTLKHKIEGNERERVKGDLYHIFDFRFWQDSIKIELKNNWNEIYKGWMTF